MRTKKTKALILEKGNTVFVSFKERIDLHGELFLELIRLNHWEKKKLVFVPLAVVTKEFIEKEIAVPVRERWIYFKDVIKL